MVALEESSQSPGASVVVVTSASRGLGVTSVAIHLAASIASRRGCCLVDLDRTWGGAAARLGLTNGHRTWGDCNGSAESLRTCALPVPGAFRVLAAPPEDDETPLETSLLVGLARGSFGVVVADVPADSPHRYKVCATADAVLLVVAPTHEGVRRARTAAGRLPDVRLGFIANRLGPGSDVPMSELVPILGCPALVELPCTPALRDAEDEHRLLSRPWTRWARGVEVVARTLERREFG